MKVNSLTKLYCLIGNPIVKSLSPTIHNYIFDKEKENAVYMAFNIEKKDFENVINSFKAINVKGFNVTIPYKIDIINFLDELSYESELIGAVNTVKIDNGKLIGYNTDGLGFLKTFEERNISLKGKNILILGAGGAAQSIALTVANEGANSLTILNRTVSKSEILVRKIKDKFPEIESSYGSLNETYIDFKNIDILINCTSIGMYPEIDKVPIEINKFNKNVIVYDIIYKPLETELIKSAKKEGMIAIGGLDMLLYQALLSDEIWLNRKLDIEKIKDTLKRRILLENVEVI
ncbi:shikimate dehydrogenase [Caloranaerobacter sp. TR13]|uniref:shikimate dehydrogenase n=1 Tax=Caloranaerobacter sp. TR13 TaxID=1302151 RepID=UPI0006D3AD54|nr:shikimate dehydrogenase [Caloranaerobacter sp. TR13]KPU28062.1 shikimate dehydrogenase [Caloranaerobacter sp. TR13]